MFINYNRFFLIIGRWTYTIFVFALSCTRHLKVNYYIKTFCLFGNYNRNVSLSPMQGFISSRFGRRQDHGRVRGLKEKPKLFVIVEFQSLSLSIRISSPLPRIFLPVYKSRSTPKNRFLTSIYSYQRWSVVYGPRGVYFCYNNI